MPETYTAEEEEETNVCKSFLQSAGDHQERMCIMASLQAQQKEDIKKMSEDQGEMHHEKN